MKILTNKKYENLLSALRGYKSLYSKYLTLHKTGLEVLCEIKEKVTEKTNQEMILNIKKQVKNVQTYSK